MSAVYAVKIATIQRRSREFGFFTPDCRFSERRFYVFTFESAADDSFLSILLMATTVASYAAAPDDPSTTSSFGVIHTYVMPDLSLKSVFSLPALPQPTTGFRKTCRCSCGTGSCSTDADCGGGVGSCSHFISCCAKGDKAQWFLGSEQSSRKTELPAFNGSCN